MRVSDILLTVPILIRCSNQEPKGSSAEVLDSMRCQYLYAYQKYRHSMIHYQRVWTPTQPEMFCRMCVPITGTITDAVKFCIHTASTAERQSLIYNLQNMRIGSMTRSDNRMDKQPSHNTILCKKWIESVLQEVRKLEPPVITCPMHVHGVYLDLSEMTPRLPTGPVEC